MFFPCKFDYIGDAFLIFTVEDKGGAERLRDTQLLNSRINLEPIEDSKREMKGIEHSYVLSFKDPLEGRTLSLYFSHCSPLKVIKG